MKTFNLNIIQRYVIKQFLGAFSICLLIAISLFLIFDLFDHSRIFVKEGSTILQTAQYLLFKIPLIVN